MPLKYLFTAKYSDGTEYKQNADDRSVLEPDKRSCFYDIDQTKLVEFILEGEGQQHSVNLKTGAFTVNGTTFKCHVEPEFRDFRLIFWRNHTHHFNVGEDTQEETAHQVKYIIGWQCTVNGENHQRIIQVT